MGAGTFVVICKKGTLEEVREALANGADVNEKDELERTSLMQAVLAGNEPLVSLLLQQPGIQVNVKNNIDWTALHYAAFHNRTEEGRKVIKLLLNFPGIDTEITDNCDYDYDYDCGQTPLMWAKKKAEPNLC